MLGHALSQQRLVAFCLRCEGRIAVSGMGKAGIIGEKISATMASTGTPSFFVHPAEAVHGDLGRTEPSVGSLLGCEADIWNLDVLEVHTHGRLDLDLVVG